MTAERASLVVKLVKDLPTMWETWTWPLGWEDPLEKGKAVHSSVLAWRVPWTFHGVAKSPTQLSNWGYLWIHNLPTSTVSPLSLTQLAPSECCWLPTSETFPSPSSLILSVPSCHHFGNCKLQILHNPKVLTELLCRMLGKARYTTKVFYYYYLF